MIGQEKSGQEMAGWTTGGQTKWKKLFELMKKARVLDHRLYWPQQKQMWRIKEVLTKMVDPWYELSSLGPKIRTQKNTKRYSNLGLVWLLCGDLKRNF